MANRIPTPDRLTWYLYRCTACDLTRWAPSHRRVNRKWVSTERMDREPCDKCGSESVGTEKELPTVSAAELRPTINLLTRE